MAVFLQPIYTQTVGAGGAASITFNNIPQTFTDLKLVVSGRVAGAVIVSTGYLRFNGDTGTNYSRTSLYGDGTNTASDRTSPDSGITNTLWLSGANATSNTFGTTDIYIPNYAGSNFKSIVSESVSENNATTSYQNLNAGLWRSTSAITSITVLPGSGGNFVQYSTFSLYGILRSGV